MPWDQTANEIRQPVRPSTYFRDGTFRTMKLKGTTGVSIVMAKLKPRHLKGREPGKMVIQAYRFARPEWTVERAKAWFARNVLEKG